MLNRFEKLAKRMDEVTIEAMGKPIEINGVEYIAIPAQELEEMGSLAGMGTTLVVFSADYRPKKNDVVFFDGREWAVTRWQMYNCKPQITIE